MPAVGHATLRERSCQWPRTGRPVDLGSFQVAEPHDARLLFLGSEGDLSGVPDAVGGGDQQTEGALGALGSTRSGQEVVDVALGDGGCFGVGLGLDRPQVSLVVFGHKVDTGVGAPPAGPVSPESYPVTLVPVDRVVRQKPLSFEMLPGLDYSRLAGKPRDFTPSRVAAANRGR